jgi:putative DNA primase/helicase
MTTKSFTVNKKPQALKVQPENIPESLKRLNRWVVWTYEPKNQNLNDSWTKVPRTVRGTKASVSQESMWSSFDAALESYVSEGFDGIGFILGNGLHGIDLDDSRDPITGELSALAQETLSKVAGYAEVSPSGTGIKIITPTNMSRSQTDMAQGIELYESKRYFCLTGWVIPSHQDIAHDIQDVGWLNQKIGGSPTSRSTTDTDSFANLKLPMEGWSIERVRSDLIPHLDLTHYDDWLEAGIAFHHQGAGTWEWLELWDEASESKTSSGNYHSGQCEQKWDSFNVKNRSGNVQITLASLIKKRNDQIAQVKRKKVDGFIEKIKIQVNTSNNAHDLITGVAATVRPNRDLSNYDRDQIAGLIMTRSKQLNLNIDRKKVEAALQPQNGLYFPDTTDKGKKLDTKENLIALLDYLGITVRYNMIKKYPMYNIPDFVCSKDNRDNVTLAHIISECSKHSLPSKNVNAYLAAIGDANQYNPVTEWVCSSEWDGVSRLPDLYASVKGPASDKVLREKLIRKWLIQCVAAAFSANGIANQGVLTLVGPQNIGKTTWLSKLAPSELDVILTGHTIDTKNKDTLLTAISHWIVELGELDATFKKSDIAALKSFITQTDDKIRRPYAVKESTYPRRTAFAASVNDREFLNDPTGNRRFWTIEVQSLDIYHGIDMQQLWVEVFHLWKAGESWNLSMDDVQELNAFNDDFTAIDPIYEKLATRFAWDQISDEPHTFAWTTITTLLESIGIDLPNKQQVIAAGRAVSKLNGNRRKKAGSVRLVAVPSSTYQDFYQH